MGGAVGKRPVLVVGGGLAGLRAALDLAMAGREAGTRITSKSGPQNSARTWRQAPHGNTAPAPGAATAMASKRLWPAATAAARAALSAQIVRP